MLAGAALLGLGTAQAARAAAAGDFLWGVATAAHQIEGNNFNSDYWVLETIPSTGFKDRSGDACDSWHRWPEDVALAASLGLNCYRYSVEWARIEPEPGMFSMAALDHYRRIGIACRKAGLTPMVTFHHFTSPRWIAARGGWENPEIPGLFARYCERTARALGREIDWACTMNEPNAQVTSFIMQGEKPYAKEPVIRAEAARAVGSDRFGAYFSGDAFRVRDNCIAAHAKATVAIKSAAPHIRTGLTLALQDLRAGEGGERLRRRIFDNARAPFYAAASADDFIGVQPYMRLTTGPAGYLPTPEGVERNRAGVDVSPDVLGAVVREVHANCRAPIIITENGIDTEDDAQRGRHLAASLDNLKATMASGITVLGYIHWSLLDNFEWSSGYAPRFGLVAVDRETFVRTPKPSAAIFRRLVREWRR